MKDYLYSLMTDKRRGILAGGVKFILFVLSILFLFGVVFRRLVFKMGILKSCRLSRPVISVGNVTLGGVGKTPLVLYMAQALKDKGKDSAVLLRGYMPDKTTDGSVESDEARMIEEALPGVPVGVGRDRRASGERILENSSSDVFILDDGFQHWQVRRDLDVVAIDTTKPFGNGHLLPRGILREPLYSLRRAHVFVLTRCDLGQENIQSIEMKLNRINPRAQIFQSVHAPQYFQDLGDGQRIALPDMVNKRCLLLCAVGNPDGFCQTVSRIGMTIERDFVYRDHHVYTEEELSEIASEGERLQVDYIVTTYKDAIKLRELSLDVLGEIKIVFLQVSLQIKERENEFIDRLYSVCDR